MYLSMCFICRFMVTVKSVNQYSKRMGQNTGRSNMGKNVMKKPISTDLNAEYLEEREKGEVRKPPNRWRDGWCGRRRETGVGSAVCIDARCAREKHAARLPSRTRT